MPADLTRWAYFDTSVLVKCYVEEPGTAEATALLRRHTVLSSTADRAQWTLLEMDSHVLARAEALAGAAPV